MQCIRWVVRIVMKQRQIMLLEDGGIISRSFPKKEWPIIFKKNII